MKTVTFIQDIDSEYDNSYSCENHQNGLDFSGTYCLASEAEAELAALRAEVERLKADIQEENDKLSLAAFRNLKQHLALECDKIAQAYDIRFSSEKQLRSDLAEAVGIMVKAALPLGAINLSVRWELTEDIKLAVKDAVESIRAFLARREVKT